MFGAFAVNVYVFKGLFSAFPKSQRKYIYPCSESTVVLDLNLVNVMQSILKAHCF